MNFQRQIRLLLLIRCSTIWVSLLRLSEWSKACLLHVVQSFEHMAFLPVYCKPRYRVGEYQYLQPKFDFK